MENKSIMAAFQTASNVFIDVVGQVEPLLKESINVRSLALSCSPLRAGRRERACVEILRNSRSYCNLSAAIVHRLTGFFRTRCKGDYTRGGTFRARVLRHYLPLTWFGCGE